MHVVVHADQANLARAHGRDLAERIRKAFHRLAGPIARVVLRISGPAGSTRHCRIEVHLRDGEIAVVEERQRRLGALVRRATARAWTAAASTVARKQQFQPILARPDAGAARAA